MVFFFFLLLFLLLLALPFLTTSCYSLYLWLSPLYICCNKYQLKHDSDQLFFSLSIVRVRQWEIELEKTVNSDWFRIEGEKTKTHSQSTYFHLSSRTLALPLKINRQLPSLYSFSFIFSLFFERVTNGHCLLFLSVFILFSKIIFNKKYLFISL